MEEKKGEQKEADEEKDGDEEKKENRDEVSMNYDSLYQIPVEPTFYEDLKNCSKILTLWELTDSGCVKKGEEFFFLQNSYSSIAPEFSTDGRFFIIPEENKFINFYDANTLSRISRFELKGKDLNGNDYSYYYSFLVSFDGSYIITGDGYQRLIFDNKGNFIKCINGRNMYSIYMYSATEFIGSKATSDYMKTNMISIDFINDTEKIVYEFESYISYFTLSPDRSTFMYDAWPKQYTVNMKTKEKTEIIKENMNVYNSAFKGDKYAMMYNLNYSTYHIAVYQNGKQLWKQNFKKYVSISSMYFTDDSKDTLIMVDTATYGEYKVIKVNEDEMKETSVKMMGSTTFQSPYIIYVKGANEIWFQSFENVIDVLYFDYNIVALENSLYSRYDYQPSLGIALDYYDHYIIGYIDRSYYGFSYSYYQRKIYKNEIPHSKLKCFYKIRMQNQEKKKVEDSVLLHLSNCFVGCSLESSFITSEYQCQLSKRYVVYLKDRSAMILWDPTSSKIERIKIPLDPSTNKWTQKVYEGTENIKYCKSTFVNDIEHICIVDEARYFKILKIEDSRLLLYKDYYVDNYFATSTDIESLKGYSFLNEMLYSSNGGILLQEKGKEKDNRFYTISYSGYYLNYNDRRFPICSNDFILQSLNPEYVNNDYSKQYSYLLLLPPMNSNLIKQRVSDYGTQEFFLHFDERYLLTIKKISICQNKEANQYAYFEEGNAFSAPTFKIYKIKKSDEYKQKIIEVDLNQQSAEAKPIKDLVSFEFVTKYDVPHDCLKPGYYGEDYNFWYFNNTDSKKQIFSIDNIGNVICIYAERKAFIVNKKNLWSTFEEFMKKHKINKFEDFEIITIGQECIIFKHFERLFYIKYDGKYQSLTQMKEIKHKALDIKECDMEYIIPTTLSNFITFFYKLGNSNTVIVWDVDNDCEHSNFSSRAEDKFTDYFTGKDSKYGYLCYDTYIVDLDLCIPNPFIKKKTGIEPYLWNQGMRINTNEDVILTKGTIYTPICHKDIYYNKNRSIDNLDLQKVIYYIDKKSALYDYLDDFDNLSKVLALFEHDTIYYSMIVLENKDNKTPLDIAIENNSAKVIELMLNMLIKIEHFSYSSLLYKKFGVMFRMNLKAFEKYLNTCYFVTYQMKCITKISLKADETIREAHPSCILDKEFYKKYNIGGVNQDKHYKANEVVPAQVVDQPPGQKPKDQDKETKLKRVSVRGIEFDWIFCTPEGASFLKDLSETENVNIFGQSIIRDIILFQWSYFKTMIILKLLIPYVIYFVTFCVYATYIVKNQATESSTTGVYHIFAIIIGVIILIFNIGWGYVETTQMLFHKLEYFKSFWNLLDLSSVILNVCVVIMEFSNADFRNINRVSGISVLILYFKLFYFLRIFFATAYLVRMIIEIVLDMKFFVSVLMIGTMAFANSFYIFGRNSDPTDGNLAGSDISQAFIFSYRIGLGDFDTSGFTTRDQEILWIVFFLNTMIIQIVLLNLVIAIMGDTFDRVQETQENSMLRELAQMIRENEFLFSRRRYFKRSKYIIVIEPEKRADAGVAWEGKLNQLKNFIEQSSEDHIQHLQKLKDSIKEITASSIDEKMRPIEEKINYKLSACDQRMEKYKKSMEELKIVVENFKKMITDKSKSQTAK